MSFEDEIIKQANSISKQIIDMKECIIESLGYNPFESFEESIRSDYREINKYLETAMFHILKFYFSTNDDPKYQWLKTIERSLENFRDGISINNKLNRNILKMLEKTFLNTYLESYKDYQQSAKIYTDLLYNIDNIPIKCPWTLEDFLYKDIDELLEILGDVNNG